MDGVNRDGRGVEGHGKDEGAVRRRGGGEGEEDPTGIKLVLDF